MVFDLQLNKNWLLIISVFDIIGRCSAVFIGDHCINSGVSRFSFIIPPCNCHTQPPKSRKNLITYVVKLDFNNRFLLKTLSFTASICITIKKSALNDS